MSQTTETNHSLTVQVRVTDSELCVKEAKDFFGFKTDLLTPEMAMYAFLINPSTAPADSGYELLQGSGVTIDGKMATLTINARVFDSEALYKEAAQAYTACWGGSIDDLTATIETWLYEALVASNASPAHCTIGYEIIDMIHPGPPILSDEPGYSP